MTGALPAPLAGVTVIELANWVAVPSCAALMADMGARVIKVEPLGGDGMRHKLRQPASPPAAEGFDYPFQLDNRGKASVAIDLASPAGAELVRRLVGGADVVLTNLLPERLSRFGLDPESLCAAHPGLVYGLVTGYGRTGPDANRAAFDLTAFFGKSGIMSLIGEPDAPPPSFRAGQGDHPTGLALLVAVLAALRVRDQTGRGQVVETCLQQVGMWSIGCDLQSALVDGQQPSRRSRADAFSPMNTQYLCADGSWINLSAQGPDRWAPLCAAIGRPDLAAEPYTSAAERFRHRHFLITELESTFASKAAGDWAPALDEAGLVWARVAQLPEVVSDPQAEAFGAFAEIDHPQVGTFRTLAAPFRLEHSPVQVQGPAPDTGEDTEEVLTSFGLGAEELSELRAAGVIGPSSP